MHNKSTLSFCRTHARHSNGHTRFAVCDCWLLFRQQCGMCEPHDFKYRVRLNIQLSKWCSAERNVWMVFFMGKLDLASIQSPSLFLIEWQHFTDDVTRDERKNVPHKETIQTADWEKKMRSISNRVLHAHKHSHTVHCRRADIPHTRTQLMPHSAPYSIPARSIRAHNTHARRPYTAQWMWWWRILQHSFATRHS